jgi:hypothetical protein
MSTKDDGVLRGFTSGATRDTAEGKLDFDGFISAFVMRQYARYMNMNRLQSDGKIRDSDNWQKGIPMPVYIKSKYRHWEEMWYTWKIWQRIGHMNMPRQEVIEFVGAICGDLFNTMGFLHEFLKENAEVRFDDDEPTNEMRERQENVEQAKRQAEEPDQEVVCPWCCRSEEEGHDMVCPHLQTNAGIMGFTGNPEEDLSRQTATCGACRHKEVHIGDHPCDCCSGGDNFSPKDEC